MNTNYAMPFYNMRWKANLQYCQNHHSMEWGHPELGQYSSFKVIPTFKEIFSQLQYIWPTFIDFGTLDTLAIDPPCCFCFWPILLLQLCKSRLENLTHMPVPKVSVLHLAEIVVAEKLLNFDEIAQVAAGIGVQSDAMDDICTEAVFTFPQGIFSPPKSPVNTCHFRKSTFLKKYDHFLANFTKS